MATFLCGMGFLCWIGCIVWFIVRLIKRKPKKPAGIGILICFIAMMAGGMLYSSDTTEQGPKDGAEENSIPESASRQASSETTSTETAEKGDSSEQVSNENASSEPAEKGDSNKSAITTPSDWEIVTREGHPTYYGSVELSHTIWDDIEKGKIVFADGYNKWGDKSILSMDAYRNSDLIRGVYVSFSNFEEPVEMTVDDILPVIASYMPFEVMDQYYQFCGSELYAPNEERDNKNRYYAISYNLTEEASAAYYDDKHEYSGTIDVLIETSESGIVECFNIDFGLPRWVSSLNTNNMHSEEWACDLYDYR